MRINTNINSMRTQEYMRQNQDKMNVSMNRLSSGKRINSAADDAAGLAIATRMRARQSGLEKASQNTQDGMSLIRTAESAMNSVSNILTRMRDIAVQSSNGTNTDKNQSSLQKEFAELQEQIDYIANNTEFNDKNLLAGTASITIGAKGAKGTEIKIETLDTAASSKQISINLSNTTASNLGVAAGTKGIAINSSSSALAAISAIDAALTQVAGNRATLGATLNRLDRNVENLNNQATNMASSASQIEDADMAKEMSEMTKFKILNEAGISMLSQANQTPQMVSKLLQ
ncbi:flagellin [Bacillus sp. S70]|uniref:flagellin N-terminal helical domain-containing protein n=1 Tax=unclassified Bacillus (in: firmicutes) TaxID=185979 RepID=UPI00190AA636|nr:MULTISPECIES: flagellin [unclassified Bacillus (in: firmicutes)]MBJ9979019.1 flagellin [Bacillus sp. S29]MBK0099916.1 flagellin [Bacillus sp. S70]MBK0108003.1 flagellin [Bacillus sp. S73]MBK0136913.1 flagellin [Bacillus sp. S72]MBK0150975.1 flagellin [Bacillus sp. S74]